MSTAGETCVWRDLPYKRVGTGDVRRSLGPETPTCTTLPAAQEVRPDPGVSDTPGVSREVKRRGLGRRR